MAEFCLWKLRNCSCESQRDDNEMDDLGLNYFPWTLDSGVEF